MWSRSPNTKPAAERVAVVAVAVVKVVSWCHRRRGRRGRRRVVGRCLVVLHAPEIAGRAGGLRVRHQHPETHGQQVQKTA